MKKISTYEGAKRLGVHPAELFFYLAKVAPSLEFGDVWPEVDEAWIETISVQKGVFPSRPGTRAERIDESKPAVHSAEFSAAALHVIDKLRRHRKWGHMAVTFEGLINLTHLSARDLHDAIDELRRRDLIDRVGLTKDTVSLNPSKTREIKAIKTSS
jgi:hypothetical protein